MTTTAVAKKDGGGELIAGYTRDQVDLIKETVCKPKKRAATDNELALFLHQCRQVGLDPFSGQVYAIFYGDNMSIVTGIDGLRILAERTGNYEGQTPTEWCNDDGDWSEIWTKQSPPIAAKSGVRRKGGGEPTYAIAHWKEFNKGDGNWKSMPVHMLGKCAEALALRKAFPAATGGVYTPEEAPAEKPALEPLATDDREQAAEIDAEIKSVSDLIEKTYPGKVNAKALARERAAAKTVAQKEKLRGQLEKKFEALSEDGDGEQDEG